MGTFMEETDQAEALLTFARDDIREVVKQAPHTGLLTLSSADLPGVQEALDHAREIYDMAPGELRKQLCQRLNGTLIKVQSDKRTIDWGYTVFFEEDGDSVDVAVVFRNPRNRDEWYAIIELLRARVLKATTRGGLVDVDEPFEVACDFLHCFDRYGSVYARQVFRRRVLLAVEEALRVGGSDSERITVRCKTIDTPGENTHIFSRV